LVGFSGDMLAEVMMGGEFVLGSAIFCFSQEKLPAKQRRRKK